MVLTLPLIASCTVDNATNVSPLTPIPRDAIDPDDDMVKPAVDAYIKSTRGPAASSYDVRRIDLNGDRRREAIVLFKSPYGHWCETHGCTLLVLKANDHKFSPLSTISPVREPVYIAKNKSYGWHDLIVRMSGRSDKAKNVALRFNGSTYPPNPTNLPRILGFEPSAHRSLFRERKR